MISEISGMAQQDKKAGKPRDLMITAPVMILLLRMDDFQFNKLVFNITSNELLNF